MFGFVLILASLSVACCMTQSEYYERHKICNNEDHVKEGPEGLEDGWYSPFNGKQYMSIGEHSWQNSRDLCIDAGGDLVTQGVRDPETRDLIGCVMKSSTWVSWIGANDIDQEGDYMWVDGVVLETDDSVWDGPEEPDDGTSGNCVAIYEHIQDRTLYRANDLNCGKAYTAICEKDL